MNSVAIPKTPGDPSIDYKTLTPTGFKCPVVTNNVYGYVCLIEGINYLYGYSSWRNHLLMLTMHFICIAVCQQHVGIM